jgi:hypothetical protein
MHLSGHYSNPPEELETVLRWASEDTSTRHSVARAVVPERKRLGHGVVQRGVIRALAEADRAMDVGEARAAVEALLGRSVSRDSVSSSIDRRPRESASFRACLARSVPARAVALT